MTIRDIRNKITENHSLEPAVRPTGTYNGAGVDLSGFNAAMAVIYFGAYTNGTHTPTLEHSDDNSVFAVVPAAELEGSFTAVSAAGGANTVQTVGYKGSRRFLRAVMTVASGATGAASCALIVRGDPGQLPV
jgi:hypothetical protein